MRRTIATLFLAALVLALAAPVSAQRGMRGGYGWGQGQQQGYGYEPLTQEQYDAMEKIYKTDSKAINSLQAKVYGKQAELSAELSSPGGEIDESKIDALVKEINEARAKLFELMVDQRVQLAKQGIDTPGYGMMRGSGGYQQMGPGMMRGYGGRGRGMMGPGMMGPGMMGPGMMGPGMMGPGHMMGPWGNQGYGDYGNGGYGYGQ